MKVEDFKAVEFMTAKEKFMLVKQFRRFVEEGFKESHFTKRIYEHLHLHCGFIAHYNRLGFYQNYFPSINDEFFDHFFKNGQQLSWGVGVEYDDVNKHIMDLLRGLMSV